MAVIDLIPGLSATVEVAGQDVDEYRDDAVGNSADTAVNYIEAINEAQFCIALYINQFELDYNGDGLKVELLLDGRTVLRKSFPRTQECKWPERLSHQETHLSDTVVHHSFSFSELQITDSDADISLIGTLFQLGTIKVLVHRFEYLNKYRPAWQPTRSGGKGKAPPLRYPPVQTELLRGNRVSEKNLKGRAVSHQTRLSYSRQIPRNYRRSRDKRVLGPGPMATFVFKYRSRRALQSLLVIPRTPSLEPPASFSRVFTAPHQVMASMNLYKQKLETYSQSTAKIMGPTSSQARGWGFPSAPYGNADGNRSAGQNLKRSRDEDEDMNIDDEGIEIVEQRPAKMPRLGGDIIIDLTRDDDDDDLFWGIS